MTNKEKASEIASKYERWNQEDDESYGAYNGAMEMSKWKDEQFAEEKKQWVEKVCNFLENRNVLEKDCSTLASGICSITFHPDNLINDLKQAMEKQL